jgi:hypothetical protein
LGCFVLNDGSDLNRPAERFFGQFGGPGGRRHTNGLKRLNLHHDPAKASAPGGTCSRPGGRSTFAFNDGNDALSAHVQQFKGRGMMRPSTREQDAATPRAAPAALPQPPALPPLPHLADRPPSVQSSSARVAAPPGGYAAPGSGWGSDDVQSNHHFAWLRRSHAPPPRPQPMPMLDAQLFVRRPPGGTSSIVFG